MRLALCEVARDDATVTLAAVLLPCPSACALRYATRTGALLRIDGEIAGAFDREHGRAIVAGAARERELTLQIERRSLPTNRLPSHPGLRWRFVQARASQRPSRSVAVEASTADVRERPRTETLPLERTGTGASAGGVLSSRESLRTDEARSGGEPPVQRTVASAVPLWGHSHLDVAWLWTYAQTRRKALRTFAIALDLLDRDADFTFAQSQPQLYRFVQEDDPALFARVRAHAAQGRFDPDVAAMWVEPDCNLPSGESLLRQMLAAHEYCTRELGVEPAIAWLPDSFGFPNTLPTLLAHCGIERFATTKLQWNDTTRFPHTQFAWRGPDGSEVLAALIDGYDGGPTPQRLRVARERGEPLVAGYGDGGGGVTYAMLETARGRGTWQRPREWFDALAARRDDDAMRASQRDDDAVRASHHDDAMRAAHRAALPIHQDELYLQYHRGTYTTHHDLKAANAALERRLREVEEQLAWCVAVRVPGGALRELRARVRVAWEIVLRNQFHDVLPGTTIGEAAADARAEYAQAADLLDGTAAALTAMLPRAPRHRGGAQAVAPQFDGERYRFDNGIVRAVVRPDGTLLACALAAADPGAGARAAAADPGAGARNVIAQANLLALYRDRPRRWEAWNLDAGYERTRRSARPGTARVEADALEIPFALHRSRATMRVAVYEGEPFVRVDLAVDWRERRTLLRVENWLALTADRVRFGAPHGTIERSARRDTPEERAAFEVPGQRFALARGADGSGLAVLALDTYGWSARALPRGGVHLGHSLLRGTTWPDPHADLGEQQLSWAFAPVDPGTTTGMLEAAWERFAHEPRVRLFTSDDPAVSVVACKPAQDGDGVIVRARECDGAARELRLHCGGRMREVSAVDGLERPLAGVAPRIEGECVVAPLGAFALRSFRVRF